MTIVDRVHALAVTPGTPHALRPVTVPITPPKAGQVEITMIRVGVCGTDREIIEGGIGSAPEGETDLVIGHEMLGRVSKLGPVVENLAIGDLVTCTVRRPDGCPACEAGEPDMCLWLQYTERGIGGAHGFMAERIVEDERWVIKVPEELEATGVLIEPLTVVEKAVRQAELIQQRLKYWNLQRAVVMGAGPIGILGALLLRAKGVETWVVARTPAPNAAASLIEEAGAHYVSLREHSLDEIKETVGSIDLILESSGSSKVVFESIRILGNNGVLVLLSLCAGQEPFPVDGDRLNTTAVVGNKVVVGSVNAGYVDFVNGVERLAKFDELWPGLAARMITDRRTLSDSPEAIVTKLPGSIKTVVEFGSGG